MHTLESEYWMVHLICPCIKFHCFIHFRQEIFPDENFASRMFNGVPFAELPICNIRVSPNNTIITVCDSKGVPKLIRSCGIEGFKNTRKGTNIAAQATAINLGSVSTDLLN